MSGGKGYASPPPVANVKPPTPSRPAPTTNATGGKVNDGGPAYPVSLDDFRDGQDHPMPGMSLCDYFAAAALTGLLANNCAPDYSKGQCNAAAAERAWIVADHMLRYRDGIDNPCTDEGQAMLATRDGQGEGGNQKFPLISRDDFIRGVEGSDDLSGLLAEARTEADTLREQNAALVDALRPFAAIAHEPSTHDGTGHYACSISGNDLSRAAAALAAAEGGTP